MGLIAAELERQGIATVCVQTVRHVAERVRPPRSLLVPWKMGYPLGRPHDPEVQHEVIEQMLGLLEDESLVAPALVGFAANAGGRATYRSPSLSPTAGMMTRTSTPPVDT